MKPPKTVGVAYGRQGVDGMTSKGPDLNMSV